MAEPSITSMSGVMLMFDIARMLGGRVPSSSAMASSPVFFVTGEVDEDR